MRRILFLAWAEVLHVTRDKATLVQVFMVPIVQLLILSNVATFRIERSPAYVVDLDRSEVSRGLVNRFAASGHFDIIGQSASLDLANDSLIRGDATIVVVIPDGLETSLVRGEAGQVQFSVNAEKGSAAGVVQLYAASILSGYAAELNDARPEPTFRSSRARIVVDSRGWYNASLNYQHYMVPGLLVSLVTLITTLLSAQNIAREKELGTLEQLNVTPISRAQFIAGKLLPFWTLGLIDLSLGLIVGRLVFDIPIRGSVPLLLGAAMLYLVVTLSVGLWVSTLVETQQQAMFVTFFILIVYLLLSGLFTPIDSMAPWVQVASQINPVRHFVSIARAILIKGAGLAEIARPLLILAGFAVVMLTIAVRQYSKRAA